MKRVTIRVGQAGWAVHFDGDVDNFYPFKSDEPERLVKFILEKGLGIKLDSIVAARQEQLARGAEKFTEVQP